MDNYSIFLMLGFEDCVLQKNFREIFFFHDFFLKNVIPKSNPRETMGEIFSNVFPQYGNSGKYLFYGFARIAFWYDILQKKNHSNDHC